MVMEIRLTRDQLKGHSDVFDVISLFLKSNQCKFRYVCI